VITPSDPKGKNGVRLPGLIKKTPQHDNERYDGQLDDDSRRVEPDALLGAPDLEPGDAEAKQHGEEVDDAALEGSAGSPPGQPEPESDEQLVQVACYTDGHHGHHQAVLEQQIPADGPGEDFAQHRVTVGVGAAGYGDHACELGVTQRGRRAYEPCQDERERHPWSGLVGRHSAS
jgi:hypothetical protein